MNDKKLTILKSFATEDEARSWVYYNGLNELGDVVSIVQTPSLKSMGYSGGIKGGNYHVVIKGPVGDFSANLIGKLGRGIGRVVGTPVDWAGYGVGATLEGIGNIPRALRWAGGGMRRFFGGKNTGSGTAPIPTGSAPGASNTGSAAPTTGATTSSGRTVPASYTPSSVNTADMTLPRAGIRPESSSVIPAAKPERAGIRPESSSVIPAANPEIRPSAGIRPESSSVIPEKKPERAGIRPESSSVIPTTKSALIEEITREVIKSLKNLK
jgi:hypothetical protein